MSHQPATKNQRRTDKRHEPIQEVAAEEEDAKASNRTGSAAQEPTNVVEQNRQEASFTGMDTTVTTVVLTVIVLASQVR